jgi:hypothetical protein
MARISQIFWRGVTAADFFNIERGREAAPHSGGGQSYISISFEQHGLTPAQLADFLGISPHSRIETERPTIVLDDVGVVGAENITAPLEFARRYRPGNPDNRYKISRQNRQTQARHPAWSAERGFPAAPDDIVSKDDPGFPDLSLLRVYVLRLDDGRILAGFTNVALAPPSLSAPELASLFGPTPSGGAAGLIEPAELDYETWREANPLLTGSTLTAAAPEVASAIMDTEIAAGRPRGQGRRATAAERRAIELRAMDVSRAALEAEGWVVNDVSAVASYDFECIKTASGGQLHVEVKGTTGDGSAVLLTPGEVRHAREDATPKALHVVHGIALAVDPESGEHEASGGELEIVDPWSIDDHGELLPTGYEYRRMLG